VSLAGFQHALADVVASASVCTDAREDPTAFLIAYDLSERERRRLTDMLGQRGMVTCCTLHRANRLAAINTHLPLTCWLLRDRLREELQTFWAAQPATDLQFVGEADRFARFLRSRLSSGAIVDSVVEDILEFEVAVAELRLAGPDNEVHSRVRVVRFHTDPVRLMKLVVEMQPRPYDLPDGHFGLLLDARDGSIVTRLIDSELYETQLLCPIPPPLVGQTS
jgi:hypothetical protein